jgi:TRAP transporter 4TM/12TM fusion protein
MPLASRFLLPALGFLLCAFVLAEVNYPTLRPQSQLALFSLSGMLLCFLLVPVHPRLAGVKWLRAADGGLALLALLSWGYIVIQTEPLFQDWWIGGQALGSRAGQEGALDLAVGLVGLLLVLEATRRALGMALPLLAGAFLAYAWLGVHLPDWLLPHRGYGIGRIVSQTFLHSQGIFGVALKVMFTYVFLFVLFGALLERTGATGFIIEAARRLFRGSPGGPAKVAVLSSGLMGSLSGSAVANTATTGTFTIPMMRSSGFPAVMAGGIEAAASTGGALVPPVMGAGAYMMLEIIDPPVTYLQIIRAAMIPAILYYLSLFLIVHLHARRRGMARPAEGPAPVTPPGSGDAGTDDDPRHTDEEDGPPLGSRRAEAMVFGAAFTALLACLIMGYTAFRAVSLAMAVGAVTSFLSPRTLLTPRGVMKVCARAARDSVPLITAAACVGIILGVVTLTGIGTRFPALLLPLAQESLPLALVVIMISSLILGMGLPSAVCYLLLATLIGPVLGRLGVVPLAAHLFIFYFGMMSMVTPPVALAAYTAASIAGSGIMRTALAAFRIALVGFTLPYFFVFRPQLLMLTPDGGVATPMQILAATAVAVCGIVPFAAGIAGRLFTDLSPLTRALLLLAAGMILLPGPEIPWQSWSLPILDILGFGLFLGVTAADWLARRNALASNLAD